MALTAKRRKTPTKSKVDRFMADLPRVVAAIVMAGVRKPGEIGSFKPFEYMGVVLNLNDHIWPSLDIETWQARGLLVETHYSGLVYSWEGAITLVRKKIRARRRTLEKHLKYP